MYPWYSGYYLVFLLIIFGFCAQHPKQPTQRVFDYESVLDSTQIKKLTELYINHEKKTTNQIALITTSSFGKDSTIEDYALARFNQMGIGRKDINNGLLIVYSGAHRQIRIATGLGTEKVLTNSIAQHIIDSVMIPRFANNETFPGIWNGSKAIIEFLERPENKIKLP